MSIKIQDSNGPKYDQIYQYLRDQISSSKMEPGAFFPPEGKMAAEYGVSVGTVKKALGKLADEGLIRRRRGHGTQVIGPEQIAAEHSQRTSILVLLDEIRRNLFGEIYTGIIDELAGSGYHPILHDNFKSAEAERQILDNYCNKLAGAVIAPFFVDPNYQTYGKYLAAGTPFVFVDRYLPMLNVDAVVSDNELGGYFATKHLIDLGHRRIAAIGTQRATSLRDRIKGYRRALAESGLKFDEKIIFIPKDGGYDGAYEITEQIRARHPDVTGIFGLRDDAAWGCLQRLRDLGLSVPEQVSVIGFGDDLDLCNRLRPRLTTVRQEKAEMGRAAVKLLLQRIKASNSANSQSKTSGGKIMKEENEQPKLISLPVELIVRESTAPVKL